jgi:hypothetical protein
MKTDAYRLLVGKSEGKISLGRPRHMWIVNIKKDLGGTRCGGLDQDKDEWSVECFFECGDEFSGSIKCWEVLEWLHN